MELKTIIKSLSIILVLNTITLHSMTIDRVILSTDTHPCYFDFWPMMAKAWNKMGVKPTLALIATDDIEIDESLGDVIRFNPLPDIPTGFQAQVIRLFLPAIWPDEVSLTSDIDMLPLSKDYLLGSVKNIDEDKFVIYSTYLDPARQEQGINPICYLAGQGKTFGEIFGVKTIEDIQEIIKRWYQQSSSLTPPQNIKDKDLWLKRMVWSTDERMLAQYIKTWSDAESRCIKLNNGFDKNHIDRDHWGYYPHLVKEGHYHDAHLPKPWFEPLNKNAINTLLEHAGLQDLKFD